MRRGILKLFEGNFELVHKYNKGIYSIYFSGTEQYYIGSTSTKGGFDSRWRQHLQKLRNKKHSNTILQNTYNKYGEDCLKLKIIELCTGTSEQILEIEQYYIDLLHPPLNINMVAKGCQFPKGWISPLAKPVLQYDLNGNFIKEYNSINEAKRGTGLDVIQALESKNRFSRAGMFQWRFKIGKNIPYKIPKYKYTQEKSILCYDSDGNFVKEYASILQASIELNINCGNISKTVAGKMRSCNGYFFREKIVDDFPLHIDSMLRLHKKQLKVTIEDLETHECYHFNSLREIPKEIISRNSLHPYRNKGLSEFEIRSKKNNKKYKVTIQSYNKV